MIKIMKKAVLINLLVLLSLSLIPSLAQADVGDYDKDWCKDIPIEKRVGGLVPCGRACNDPSTEDIDESKPCELCDFFVMLDRIIDFLLFRIVPVLAALMIAIGGGMYIISQGDPGKLSRVKELFTAIVYGLLIIYGAWVFVNTFFMLIGINDFNEFKTLPQNWWKIPCP